MRTIEGPLTNFAVRLDARGPGHDTVGEGEIVRQAVRDAIGYLDARHRGRAAGLTIGEAHLRDDLRRALAILERAATAAAPTDTTKGDPR